MSTLDGLSAQAQDINKAAQVVGNARIADSLATHTTLWSPGGVTDPGTLGGGNSVARAINAAGVIVGKSDTLTPGSNHAALWNRGSVADLGTLGGLTSLAYAINNSAAIVRSSRARQPCRQPCHPVDGGHIVDLGTLAGNLDTVSSSATGINDLGQIVGWSDTAGSNLSHAVLWTAGGIEDPDALLDPNFSAQGSTLTQVNAIHDAGWIAAAAYNSWSQTRSAFLFVPVSAPRSAWLVLGRATVVTLMRRRRAD